MREAAPTLSVWLNWIPPAPDVPPLGENLSADVCVIGGGIAGLTTAYLLSQEGRSVVVVELDRIGGQETSRTTAHLSDVLDEGLVELERLHGRERSRLAVASHAAAISRIEEIVAAESIDCGFERLDGYLFHPDAKAEVLDEELASARRLGLADSALLSTTCGTGLRTGPCIRFPRQAQLHPLLYAHGLVEAVERQGGRLFGHTRVVEVEAIENSVRVRTAADCRIDAAAAVCATNTPITTRFAIHTKQAAYRSYVIGARVPRDTLQHALYWDTADPYHYVRLQSNPEDDNSEIAIIGGEDHKTGQDDDPASRFGRLEVWARERIPELEEVTFRWSGQIMEPVDGLAFLGRSPGERNIYVLTGDSGHGMTHGTIGAMIVSDLIAGRENPWAELYDPDRVTLQATPHFLRENLNVAGRYTEWLRPADGPEAARIRPGEGAVLRHGLSRVAVFRDLDGHVVKRSAVCPHLGCIVAWNPLEATWDCPCHGSRFASDGRVIHGPAVADLPPVETHEPMEDPRA
jgi:glycine/D-amino acid oxidase-like deaminating enzyme/nitrite reductase/ring-hydroxylating ferredoxin subunit